MQVIEEDTATPDASLVREPLNTSKGPRESKALKEFDGYLDEPEVHAKIKELQIVRLERQIAEEREVILNPNVIGRVVAHQKAMIRAASEGKLASIRYIEEECPWCGECSMRFEELKPSTWGWRCNGCGKVAEI